MQQDEAIAHLSQHQREHSTRQMRNQRGLLRPVQTETPRNTKVIFLRQPMTGQLNSGRRTRWTKLSFTLKTITRILRISAPDLVRRSWHRSIHHTFQNHWRQRYPIREMELRLSSTRWLTWSSLAFRQVQSLEALFFHLNL